MFTEIQKKIKKALISIFLVFSKHTDLFHGIPTFLLEKYFIAVYCIFDGKISLDVAKTLRKNKISFNNYISVRGLL